MDHFDFTIALSDSVLPTSSAERSSVPSSVGSSIAPVLIDVDDVPDIDLEETPADFDHRSSGFGAYCIIA
nr:pheromone precursor [Ganoderma boninense]